MTQRGGSVEKILIRQTIRFHAGNGRRLVHESRFKSREDGYEPAMI